MPSEPTEIRPARREESLAALELLLSAMPAEARQSVAAELQQELPSEDGAPGGLWLAEATGAWSAVALAQLHAGQTASIWRPRFHGSEDEAIAQSLLQACVSWSQRRGVRAMQSLLEIEDHAAARWFAGSGFKRIARLAYLVWEATASQTLEPETELHFQSNHDGSQLEFAGLVEATYENTLDCPALNGVRAVPEVLEGYRAIGVFQPELWRLAIANGKPIGCVILAEHPVADQCELVYMGLIPAARRQGLGARLIAEAQRQTVRLGRQQLILAVDLANTPALRHYHHAGFRVWDQRDVFAILSNPLA